MKTSASRQGWVDVSLGEVISVQHGFPFKGQFFASQGDYIVVTPGNFRDEGGFKPKHPEKYYVGPVDPDYVLRRGELLVVMTEQKRGLLGSAGFIPRDRLYLHNQRLGRVVEIDATRLDRRFLYYLFNSKNFRDQIQATANGVKVRHTSPSRICGASVSLPPPDVQRKIAAVLAAYDELIENNIRRMEILEEVTQAIYREWFVEFGGPGHEAGRLVNSSLGPIPEGWQIRTLGDTVPVRLAKPRVPEYEGERDYVATADCIGFHGLSLSQSYPHAQLPSRAQHEPIQCSVWFARMANYSKVMAFYPGAREIGRLVLSSGFACLACRDPAWTTYALSWILSPAFEAVKARHATGATQVSLTDGGARQLPFLLPPESIVKRFAELTEPMYRLILQLRWQNTNLRAARDLLLPKLISGRLDIADLDIDTSWLAA